MKLRLLEWIACPVCGDSLVTAEASAAVSEIVNGELECEGCARQYPISDGIPRLLPMALSAEQEATAAAFGHEWTHFTEIHREYRDQFLDWIHPLGPQDFVGKLVLDAGCGIGRHSALAAEFGAREVVAMDLSAAVETARANTAHLPNVHVIQGDIYHPPLKQQTGRGIFDLVYSIGVLHHLPDPEVGFLSLVDHVAPGGSMFAWVYGYENNRLVRHVIDPLRRNVTTKLPLGMTHALSWPLAVLLHGAACFLYRPLRGTRAFHRLPSADYIATLADFGFRQNYSIVFDQLVAPTAFYIRREDFNEWFDRAGLSRVQISWRNRNSWRGYGVKPVTE